MKIFFSIISVLFLTGCSILGAVYDPNEYMLFTNIAYVTQNAKSVCGEDLDIIQKAAKQIKESTAYVVLFTKYKPHNREMYTIAIEIDKLAEEFNTTVTNKVTEEYCKIKLNSIQHAAEIAMRASVTKRRQ